MVERVTNIHEQLAAASGYKSVFGRNSKDWRNPKSPSQPAIVDEPLSPADESLLIAEHRDKITTLKPKNAPFGNIAKAQPGEIVAFNEKEQQWQSMPVSAPVVSAGHSTALEVSDLRKRLGQLEKALYMLQQEVSRIRSQS